MHHNHKYMSQVMNEILPSFAVLGCFAPSFYPPEKFDCLDTETFLSHFHFILLINRNEIITFLRNIS